MVSLEQLTDRLTAATKLLEQAAKDVRDLPLEPTEEHIRAIGEAMAQVFGVQHAIFAKRPDLKPAFLNDKSPNPEADRRLTVALARAYALAKEGRGLEASLLLKSFVSSEASDLHRRIADSEARRIEAAKD